MAIYKFPKTESSLDRLEQALARLESALAESQRSSNADVRQMEAKFKERHLVLETTARNVQARLDTAIDRLSTILEN